MSWVQFLENLVFVFPFLLYLQATKRSLPPILGQQHSYHCLARFFSFRPRSYVVPTNIHGMWP